MRNLIISQQVTGDISIQYFCFMAGELFFPTLETGKVLSIQQVAVSNAAR